MQEFFTVLLSIHVLGGSVGLMTGTFVLFRPKGDRQHKLWGKFFAYGMLVSATVSLILSSIHFNPFLFIIGVFTLYLVVTGLRYLRLKQLHKTQKPAALDWLIFAVMTLFAFLFLGYGVFLLTRHNNFGFVLIVFGLISALMLRSDWLTFKGKIKLNNYWLLLHLQRMTAAYIASLTAFLVVNNTFLPGIIAWMLPTIIITPLIIKWTAKYSQIKKGNN